MVSFSVLAKNALFSRPSPFPGGFLMCIGITDVDTGRSPLVWLVSETHSELCKLGCRSIFV